MELQDIVDYVTEAYPNKVKLAYFDYFNQDEVNGEYFDTYAVGANYELVIKYDKNDEVEYIDGYHRGTKEFRIDNPKQSDIVNLCARTPRFDGDYNIDITDLGA